MKTTPTYQPSGEPYDGKPRVIVIKEELDMHTFDCYARGAVIGYAICAIILIIILLLTGCSTPSQPLITTQPFSYMQYMISNGYVYRTSVVETNTVWKAK